MDSLKPKTDLFGFKTKKQLTEHVRHIIRMLGPGIVPFEHHELFMWLVERHPEKALKIGHGIKEFQIIQNVLNPKALGLEIIRIDGSKIDISWLTCIKGKQASPESNLEQAMRSAIRPQIDDFRIWNSTSTCDLCNQSINGPTHVDHIKPFRDLKQDFLTNEAITLPKPIAFRDMAGSNEAGFKDEDILFAEKWINYHKKQATLRVVCAACNLNRK